MSISSEVLMVVPKSAGAGGGFWASGPNGIPVGIVRYSFRYTIVYRPDYV